MCMTCRKEVSIAEVSAFKLFTRDEQGRLRTAFGQSFKKDLFYPSNERIRVDDENATFFAFADKREAMTFASHARQSWYANDRSGNRWRWNIVNGLVIILPVTMFEVVQEGQFYVPNDDPQCMDGYYPAYESKEIIVHDTEESRNEFYDEILKRFFRLKQYGMSAIEKEALKARLPHAAQFIDAA